MRIDEAGDDHFAGDVDLDGAAEIPLRAADPVAADGDISFDQGAGDEIENTAAFKNDIRLGEAPPLLDGAREIGDGIVHAASSVMARIGPVSYHERTRDAKLSTDPLVRG